DFLQCPALQLRQRPRFFDPNRVAGVRFVLFVVRVELLPDRDHPLVHRMRLFRVTSTTIGFRILFEKTGPIRLSLCPIFIWNFSLKSWSAKSRSWCLSSTSVKLRIFSAFINQVSVLRCQVSGKDLLLTNSLFTSAI